MHRRDAGLVSARIRGGGLSICWEACPRLSSRIFDDDGEVVHVPTSLHSSERVRWQVPANSNLDALFFLHMSYFFSATPSHSACPYLDRTDDRCAPSPATRAEPMQRMTTIYG